jgi:hypothetical protein
MTVERIETLLVADDKTIVRDLGGNGKFSAKSSRNFQRVRPQAASLRNTVTAASPREHRDPLQRRCARLGFKIVTGRAP